MQFLMYTLGDETVPMPAPTPELMEEMGAFVEEATKAGVLVATGGIAPTAMGAKITLKDGEFTVTDGPFAEAKELIGGWALLECRDLDEAIEWAKRFLGRRSARASRGSGRSSARSRPRGTAAAVWCHRGHAGRSEASRAQRPATRPRDRGGVPHGVPPAGRGPDPLRRRPRPGRGARPGRPRRGARAVARRRASRATPGAG